MTNMVAADNEMQAEWEAKGGKFGSKFEVGYGPNF
jgi:hypothetical protein